MWPVSSSIIGASSGRNITSGSTSTQINDKPVTKVWLDQKGHLGLYLGCCLILINVPGKTKVTQLTVQKPRQYPLVFYSSIKSWSGWVLFPVFRFVSWAWSFNWLLIDWQGGKKESTIYCWPKLLNFSLIASTFWLHSNKIGVAKPARECSDQRTRKWPW